MNVIKTFRSQFPQAVIGFSGHDRETAPAIAAVGMGARIIKKHITVDRNMRGIDHLGSL